jgi:hypothetical protein
MVMKNATQITYRVVFWDPTHIFWRIKRVTDPINIDWVSDDVVTLKKNWESSLASLLETVSVLRVYIILHSQFKELNFHYLLELLFFFNRSKARVTTAFTCQIFFTAYCLINRKNSWPSPRRICVHWEYMPKISCWTHTNRCLLREKLEESLQLMINAQRNENCISSSVLPFVSGTQRTTKTRVKALTTMYEKKVPAQKKMHQLPWFIILS